MLRTCLVTHSRFTPRSNRARSSDGRLTFTTAVGVVAGVHYGTANGRSDTHVTFSAGFTEVYVFVVGVADLVLWWPCS